MLGLRGSWLVVGGQQSGQHGQRAVGGEGGVGVGDGVGPRSGLSYYGTDNRYGEGRGPGS